MQFHPNNPLLFIIGGCVILFVLAQSIFFLVRAYRHGKRIGITNATLRKTVLWVLLLGGTAVCITGVALSVNYIRRKCCKRQKRY